MTERKLYLGRTADPPPTIYCDECHQTVFDFEDHPELFTAEDILRAKCDCKERKEGAK